MSEYGPVSGKERWLEEKEDDKIVLDDGPLWQVDPEQLDRVRDWVRFSRVSVTRNENKGEYRYAMVNGSYLQEARARYLGTFAARRAR